MVGQRRNVVNPRERKVRTSPLTNRGDHGIVPTAWGVERLQMGAEEQRTMKANKLLLTASLLAVACLSTGCESMSNTGKGALIGGGAGAGVGALAGGGKGALVGGLVGSVVGGVVGNDVDQQEKKRQEMRLASAEARAAANQQPRMGLTDVVQMTREGINETVIINQIRSSGSSFQLSNEDIRFLTANGVSSNVIVEMQSRRPTVRVIREAPQVIYTQPAPVYVEQGPIIGVGGYYRR